MNVITCWLQERYPIVSPRDFYREIFPSGELDIKDAFTEHRYTGIIAAVTNKKKADGGTLTRRYTLTDDLDAIDIATASDDFCICAPISYAGKRRSGLNARFLYAFAFLLLVVDQGHIYIMCWINLFHYTGSMPKNCKILREIWNGAY